MANGELALESGAGGAGATENGLADGAEAGVPVGGVSAATAKGDGGGVAPGDDWFANVSNIPRVLLMVKGVFWPH